MGSVVDSCQGSTLSGTSFTTDNLGAGPEAGDVLVAAFNISQFTASRDLDLSGLPDWIPLDAGGAANADCRMRVVAHICDGTEGTSFTFSFTGTGQTHSGTLIQARSVLRVVSNFAIANAGSTTVTATNTGDLPLGFFVQNDGTSDGNTTNTIATGGWTTDENVAPSFHAGIGGHGPATTASLAVAPTASWGGTVASPLAAITVLADGASIPAPDGAGEPWQLNVDAAYSGSDLRLTPAVNSSRGSAIYTGGDVILDGLYLAFQTEMSGGGGADGICLLLLDPTVETTASCGSNGGGCGYDGLTGSAIKMESYAADFGWFFNGAEQQSHGDGSLGGIHDWTVQFTRTAAGTYDVTVTKDGSAYVTWTGVNAPDLVLLGFSGGTGGINDNHYVRGFVEGAPTTHPPRQPIYVMRSVAALMQP